MLDHVAVQARNVEASVTFYLTVFAALGFQEAMRYTRPNGLVVGFSGADGFPHFWLGPSTLGTEAAAAACETHIAFTAPDREAVDRVHAAALAAGAEVLHAAREWPEYHPNYYGVFVRDPDGNNVEAVCHRPSEGVT